MNSNFLLEKIENSKPLDFGTIFGEAIELFKKTWGQGVLLMIATFLLILPGLIILYIPILGAAIAQSNSSVTASETTPAAIIPFLLLLFPVLLITQTLSLGLMAGFHKIVRSKDLNQGVENNSLFMFLKKPYLGKLFKLAFFSLVIALLATLLCVFPAIYVSVPLQFVALIFAFNPELSAKETLKASFKLGNKKWLITFGLILVSSFLAQIVGMILCVIGLLFTASFTYLPTYLVYKEAVGFDDDNEISQIGTSEV